MNNKFLVDGELRPYSDSPDIRLLMLLGALGDVFVCDADRQVITTECDE